MVDERVIGFSYDERVYPEDLWAIIRVARKYPNSKVYTASWNRECQTFVIADNQEEAATIYNNWVCEDKRDISEFEEYVPR